LFSKIGLAEANFVFILIVFKIYQYFGLMIAQKGAKIVIIILLILSDLLVFNKFFVFNKKPARNHYYTHDSYGPDALK